MKALFLLFLAALAALALVSMEYDLLENFSNRPAGQDGLQIEEIMLLSTVLVLGLLIFAGVEMRMQRREIQRRVAAERHALELAFHDPLTGLPNRRHFMEELTSALAALQPGATVQAVLLMDLNNFKAVNDIFGHASGDELLIKISQRLLDAVGRSGLLARLGGDEFAVVARDLSGPVDATSIARRILAAVEMPVQIGTLEHRVGIGIGIALSSDSRDPTELLRRSDVALYRAKAVGESASRFFEADMDAVLRERTAIEHKLRRAIERDEITASYQPSIDLATGAVISFEVAPRWEHAELGNVPAARFLSVAEDSGLIRPLSDALLRRACRDACDWPDTVMLSFQLSPVLLKDANSGLRILSVIEEACLSPGRFEIAISEGALVREVDHARTVLGGLRDAGVHIALHDFGTSQSSLWHLRDLRFDKITIDKSFVEDVASNRNSAVVVQAILGLGQGLGMTISAEGIEDTEQLAILRQKGLDQAQGTLFGEALRADQAAVLVGGATPVTAASTL